MALDYGRARIGVAISDESAWIAQPLTTIEVRGPKQGLQAVAAVIAEWAPAEVVIGVPLDADGGDGAMAAEVRAWIEALASLVSVPLIAADERFSSQWAERTLAQAYRGKRRGTPRQRGGKGRIDMLAAQALLEDHLRRRALDNHS